MIIILLFQNGKIVDANYIKQGAKQQQKRMWSIAKAIRRMSLWYHASVARSGGSVAVAQAVQQVSESCGLQMSDFFWMINWRKSYILYNKL